MARPPSCTVNGIPCLLRNSITWAFRSGVKPVQRMFEFTPADADRVLAMRGPLTLGILSDHGILNVENLWALRKAESDDPQINRVLISDRRWIWEYQHIVRRFNMRRRVGTFRTSPSNHDVVELSDLVDKFAYAPYSLRDPASNAKWTAGDALANVLTEIRKFDKKKSGLQFRVLYDGGVAKRLKDLPIEDLEVNESADAALARVLNYLPQLGVYLDAGGDVHIFERAGGGEAAAITTVGGAIDAGVFGGFVDLAKYDNTRPSEVHVLFVREMEVRHDYREPIENATTAEPGDRRLMENVMPVPDYSLKKRNGDEVTMGSYVSILDAIDSQTWKSPPGIKIPKLTYRKICEAMVPYIDLWAALAITGSIDPDANWAARVGALGQHFRRTMQLNRRWTDRCLSIKAYLVGTVDFLGAQRSPSQVFCDYSIIGGQRSFTKARRKDPKSAPKYASNVAGYPEGAIEPSTKPAPARVQVVDEDQGIIYLDFSVDPSRLREQVLPGLMLNIPSEDPSLVNSFWNAVSSAGAALPRLKAGFKAAVILTMVPAGPNNNQQYHRVVVKPEDVKGMVPPAVSARIASARGPIAEVLVGAKIETARFQWPYGQQDLDVRAVEAAFGIPHQLDDTTEDGRNLAARLDRLCVNRASGGDIKKGVSLESIARGYAAKIWAGEADRYVGQKTGQLAPAVYPTGSLEEVSHEIRADGAVLTTIDLPEEVPQFEMTQFLGEQERAVLFRSIR